MDSIMIMWGGAWQGGSGREPSGSTLLKRRQLERLGYTAVAVPYWEWDNLQGKVGSLAPVLCDHLLYYSSD